MQPSPSGTSLPGDFAAFMRNYQDMVFTTAARLLADDAQAEDISQEVFLKAHRHFGMLAASPTAGGWLKTVTTNLCLNHLSRYRRRWSFFSELKASFGEDEGGEREFAAPDVFFAGMDAAERRQRVEAALARLPDSQRVPLVLYHFEELPYDEIARRTGVSLAKTKTDIHRGRLALGRSLSRHA
ncbi:MAG TPA: sigma-70 family RNA polymerase sigma factor [Opitutaceae bacterium]|nr:sigma-70 family RNA polymerase sigma factor [Opitutaceae bacterium]